MARCKINKSRRDASRFARAIRLPPFPHAGSGEIDFEEFTVVLKKQMKEGGGLASADTGAASMFGWLNPFSWFAEPPKDERIEPRSPVSAYGGGTWEFPEGTPSYGSPSAGASPTNSSVSHTNQSNKNLSPTNQPTKTRPPANQPIRAQLPTPS